MRPLKKKLLPSHRQLRLGELIRHALSQLLLREDLHISTATAITISQVYMRTDLKRADVYILPLGGHQQDAVVQMLNERRYFFRQRLSKMVTVRFVPELWFFKDAEFDRPIPTPDGTSSHSNDSPAA